jgi:8-oxo-dGTP pyrophosphatase MutT (NUDIX family)
MTQWRVHRESPIYTSRWLNLRLVEVELPRGRRFSHHVIRMNFHAAGVVVRDPELGVLLLRRHRFITDTWGWEIPAGGVDDGETAEQAVERECVEETGWRPLGVRRLGASFPSNGLIDQQFVYFTSESAEHVGEPHPDETERVEWFAPGDVRALLARGEVSDGLSVTALTMAFALGPL